MRCPEHNVKMTLDITGKYWYCKKCDNEFIVDKDGNFTVVS
jgi:hypothetical protein